MWIGLVLSYLSTTIISLVIAAYVWVLISKLKSRSTKEKASDILHILKNSKVFPIDVGQEWSLEGYHYCTRVWRRFLQGTTGDSTSQMQVFGCYTKIPTPTSLVLTTLKDIDKLREWDSTICEASYILMSAEPPSGNKSKHSGGVPVQNDLVSVNLRNECPWNLNPLLWFTFIRNTCLPLSAPEHVVRYWHREENGSCWFLQFNKTWREWWFFLAQPQEVTEMDECRVTILYHPGDRLHQWPLSNTSHCLQLAERCASLRDYFEYYRLKYVPLLSMGLPGESDATERDSGSDTSKRVKQFGANISAAFKKHLKSSSSKDGGGKEGVKSDTTFINRFKNIIEEKKNKSKAEPARRHSEPQTNEVTTNISSHDLTDDKVDESEDLYDIVETNDAALVANSGDVNLPALRRAASAPLGLGEEVSEKRLRFLSEKLDVSGATSSDGLSPEAVMAFSIPLDENGDIDYRTLANQTAAEVLAETFKASDIDISRPYDEQAQVTGGWVFCGMDRDVVILRKILEEDCPLQAYIGKGIIKASPKAVWDCLRNPLTRFTYDEMLKKVEVLQEIGDGMKIVYMHHEVAHLFRKEARDFCVLQSERKEGKKLILCLHSVDFKKCPKEGSASRGLFFSSGWIIEPVRSETRNVCSMVTYFVQMELGDRESAGFSVDEIAAKQPTSIALLRQYLTECLM